MKWASRFSLVSVFVHWFLLSLGLLIQKAQIKDNNLVAGTALKNFLKALYFRRRPAYFVLNFVYICLILWSVCLSYVHCPWLHFHGSVTKKVFSILNFSLIVSNRITLFAYLAMYLCLSDSFHLTSTSFHWSVNMIKFSWSSPYLRYYK